MSRLTTMPLLLLAVLSGTSCDSPTPDPGGSPGGLALVTNTGGIQPDSNGYTVMLDGTARGGIGPNDSLTLPDVGAGLHAVELSDVQFNCATLGQFTRTVSVSSDAEAVVNYSVACDARSRSRIGFLRDRTLAPQLFLMNADGSELTSLEDSVGAAGRNTLLSEVSWSGDGERMAFRRTDGALYATIGEGTAVVQLAPSGMSPIWSADGRKVAFLAADPNTVACCWDIFVAESDGSGVTQATDGLTLTDYDFAANGSLLVHLDDITTPRAVVVVRPDGTGSREIAPPGMNSFQFPRLSPDGTKVAFQAYPLAQGANGAGYEIYVTSTDGSGAVIDVSNNPGWDWWPAWSPDGTRIAFVSAAGASLGPGSIHVANADGTGQVAITPADMLVSQPAWSPDGTRIAYAAQVNFEEHVFVANADGSGRRDLNPSAHESGSPVWTGR